MDLNQFLRERQPRWERLTAILDRVDARGLPALTPHEADELFALYRLVSSDLNLVQTRTGNPALVGYLEGLVGRAYANLAVPRPVRPLQFWWRVMRYRFPAILRAEKALLGLTVVVMLAGTALGFFSTLAAPDTASVFLPPEHLVRTPRERVERLESEGRGSHERAPAADEYFAFTTFLFTHNIYVTVLGFALGFTFGIGTVVILFFNGAMLGSLAALYLNDGVIVFFLAWVGPHGVIELPCVICGCMAGLMLARAQFRRDAGSLRAQLRQLRPALVDLLVGTATLLVLAGIIEGGFSQINQPDIPYALKIAVAAALLAALLAYAFLMPIRRPDSEAQPRAASG